MTTTNISCNNNLSEFNDSCIDDDRVSFITVEELKDRTSQLPLSI